MGFTRKPRIEFYWSTDPTIATSVFNQTMQRDRLELILKVWHYYNNDELSENDSLFKLRRISEMLIHDFKLCKP